MLNSGYIWIIFIIFYGLCKGSREIFKKKAYEKNTVIDTLFIYILLSFLFVCPSLPSATGLDFGQFMPWIILKSFFVFLAWLMGFSAVNRMPVSLFGVLDLSRVLFSTALGVLVLKEDVTFGRSLGVVLVSIGLLLLKGFPTRKSPKKEPINKKYIVLSFGSAFLNACSGTLDKYLLGSRTITDNQLLFWYMLFVVIFYVAYILIKREKIDFVRAFKNPWIYLMALTLVLGDKALFKANSNPASTVSVMTLLKQSGVVVIILGGKFVFKEKRTAYKLLCSLVILSGIFIASFL